MDLTGLIAMRSVQSSAGGSGGSNGGAVSCVGVVDPRPTLVSFGPFIPYYLS